VVEVFFREMDHIFEVVERVRVKVFVVEFESLFISL
jgi:hypothetical protein